MIETIYSNPDLYLAHHGIKGQRWGKRNGPPYPLGAEQHSIKEKHNAVNGKVVGSVVVGAALTAIAAKSIYDHRVDILAKLGHNVCNDILGLELDPYFKLTVSNLEDCCKNINPTHNKTNCGSCAAATVANMMGGNYQALPKVPEHMRPPGGDGYDPDKLIECFEGGKWEELGGHPPTRRKTYKEFEEKCLSYGEGAKGIFYLPQTKNDLPGHYFTFTVLNGKVRILEGQPYSGGIVWDGNDIWDDVFSIFDPNGENVHIARLDNCPIIAGREKDLFMPK